MANEMGVSDVDEFLDGPLVTWFSSCLESLTEEKLSYEDLVDGVLLHNVFLQMDLHAEEIGIVSPSSDGASTRARNLSTVLANVRQYYEAELGHEILRLPDVDQLAADPWQHVREAELLLCLLLGCAVQCPNNAEFVARITRLDEPTQGAIADCIAQVVHIPDIQKAFEHVRQIYEERNVYQDRLQGIVRYNNSSCSRNGDEESREVGAKRDASTTTLVEDELLLLTEVDTSLNHSARPQDDCAGEEAIKRDAELLEWKARARRHREELREKVDDLHECKEELQQCRSEMAKLIRENERLVSEARSAKSYRDELDAANERAEKADRLEQENARYKEKLASVDFYRTRLDELREDNQLLMESKEMLSEQVNSYKAKIERMLDLEKQILELKRQVNDLTRENAVSREKYRELCEENAQLERLVKSSTSEALENGFILDSDDSSILMDNSLSEQLTNSAQSQALKLEVENRRLSTLVDSLKENSFHESSSKILDLEMEKKKLSIMVDALKNDLKRLSRKNVELESICEKAFEENAKLQQPDSEDLSSKYADLEKKYDVIVKEKKRLQTLLESVQRSLSDANRKLEEKKVMKDAMNETRIKQKDLESRIVDLESEKRTALREVDKQREIVKEKLGALDASAKIIEDLEKKLEKLEKQSDDSALKLSKLENLADLIDKNSYNTVKLRKSPNKDEKVLNISREENNGEVKLHALIETFESQSAQNALKLANSQLAAEKEILQKSRQKLSYDQEQLKALYDQLNTDHQHVLQDRNVLRGHLRDAKFKLRRQSESIENLESTCKYLEEECKNLKSNNLRHDHMELKEDFSKLYKANEAMIVEYRRIKSEFGKLTTRQASHQEELKAKSEKIISLELQINKLNDRCEVLVQMSEGLEKDKRALMDHITQLLKQNNELITQSLEDKEYYHHEELKNTDKVNNLSRQKEKLEEKIMDHYKRLENCSAKKKSVKASIVKSTFFKVRRAGSELFSRSRRSWAEESTPAAERSYDFEYTRGHESDVSLDDHRIRTPRESTVSDFAGLAYPRSRKSLDVLENFRPSDFTFGENLEPRSRKSMEFLDFCPFDNDGNDELDSTLHDSSSDEKINSKNEEGGVFSKSVDLSFEKEESVTSDAIKDNIEIFEDKVEQTERSKLKQTTWSEFGCV